MSALGELVASAAGGCAASDWPDEMVARFRRLWAEGIAAAEIGERLGVSKSAVTGKRMRLDLPPRTKGSPRKPKAEAAPRPHVRRPPPPPLPVLPSVAAEAAPCPSAAAAPPPAPSPPRPVVARPPQPAPSPRYGRVITCCWPIGEPGTRAFRFCEDPSEPGKPYCDDHAKLAYIKIREREAA